MRLASASRHARALSSFSPAMAASSASARRLASAALTASSISFARSISLFILILSLWLNYTWLGCLAHAILNAGCGRAGPYPLDHDRQVIKQHWITLDQQQLVINVDPHSGARCKLDGRTRVRA